MKIRDIISKEEYIYSEIDDEVEFDRLTVDIGEATQRDILIIPNWLKVNFDTVKSSPLAVICDKNALLPHNIPTIRVESPRLAMAKAFHRYEGVNLDGVKLIGITGTNGKGTTAEFIKAVLTESGYRVGFIGTGKIEIMGSTVSDKYYSMTTPDPPLLYKILARMVNMGCNAIIMEVSSHALALDKVAPLVFDYGIFTNLSREHMDFHIDMESYFQSKLKLFENCKCGIINIDDEYGKRMYNLIDHKKISAGILWRGDVWASNIENNGPAGVRYIYHQNSFSFKMTLGTAGVYNVYNSMLAATTCIDMGCRPCEVKRILGDISALPGRFEIINDEISVIIDYAHTISAFRNIMKELCAIKANKKLSVVFGCGGNRDKEKRPRMAKISERYADRVIVTSDNSRSENIKDIISDITRGFEGGNYCVIENRKEAIRTAILSANEGDLVAVIGKGVESYYIDQTGYHDYSESEIIKSALAERRSLK